MRRLATALILVLTAAPAFAAGPPPGGKLPNGGRPAQHVDFPDIKDWSSLRISLMRTLCYGTCPSYTVTVAGDGTVTWHGDHFVKVQGDATAHIAPEKVRELFERFRKAQYFWLLDSYTGMITDMPAQNTTIAFDGHTKAVHDYAGQLVGMPEVVSELERAIDEAANTTQWIGPADDPARQMPH